MAFDARRLLAPFDPKLVSWRVGQVLKSDPKRATALCYIDARDVMQRLDDAVGAENWSDSYVETIKGRVIASIAIRIDDVWVSKSDGAGDTAVEGEKGGVSDAFKRAAVKWGIGRYLYDVPMQWVAIDPQRKTILPSEYAKLQKVLPGSIVYAAPAETPHDPQTGEILDRKPPPAYVTSILDGAALALKAEIADELALVSELDAMEPLVQRHKARLLVVKKSNPAVYDEIRAMLSSRKAALMADPATALRA